MEHPGISLDGNQGNRWSMRLWVLGAVFLSCLVFVPLVWHVANTFQTFQAFSDSHQESEILRDRLSHLNQNIVIGTRDLVACGDGDPGPFRKNQILELSASLAQVRKRAITCQVLRFVARADSAQTNMRVLESIALNLGGAGAMRPAQDLLQGHDYWRALGTFNSSLDSLTYYCSTTRNQALDRERSREVGTLAGAAVLLLLSLGTWTSLLRRIESRERQLGQAQKMECVGRIASGIAHDFSNLLTAIRGYTSVASSLVELGHPATHPLNQISLASTQAIEVARSLLTFANGSKQAGELLDLGQAFSNVLQLLRPSLPQEISLQASPPPLEELWVKGDRSLLQQALLNLGLNAKEAMPHGGTIGFALSRSDDQALIEITDEGVGIPQELLPRIWEPFFTTKTEGKGTGLGLFNVKSALDSCHGTFNVSARPEGGTVFSLLIPLESAPRPSATGFPLAEICSPGWKILLAEPHGFACEVMAEALRFKGFMVHPVANGVALLAEFKQGSTPEEVTVPDLVIMDLDLPEARKLNCLQEIRKISANLPIILVGSRQETAPDDGLDKHTVILNKPFEMKELCRLAYDIILAYRSKEEQRHGKAENSARG